MSTNPQRFLGAIGGPLARADLATVQLNLGRVCNQACSHCHVEAGPKRSEQMSAEVVERVLQLITKDADRIAAIDITGGAPELNPHFRHLVRSARALGLHVMDRCNLTVLLEPGQERTAEFLAQHQVEIVASMPCYTQDNVDRQRGRGVFERSIHALGQLNALGYGVEGSGLALSLVYNPGGAFLPPAQAGLESDYRTHLGAEFGLVFTRLLTMANMPIKRFHDHLVRHGDLERYLQLLVDAYNPATVEGLMCRHLISIGWDGQLFDCDFNQMLDLPAAQPHLDAVDSLFELVDTRIAVADHCFGCTAGAGSSCGGTLA